MTNAFNDFIFNGKLIEDIDLPRLGHKIGVGEDIVHASIDTETGGRWLDSKGRLPMLYEPHKAYEYSSGVTRQKLVQAGLAYKNWGEKPYPKDSYPRLLKAMEIDETIALMASSWGAPQILGKNYKDLGYETVQDMVLAFLSDQDKQLEGMIDFIKANHLDDELRVLQAKLDRGQRVTGDDCRAFVAGYNGKSYEKNDYHNKFAKNLNKWVKIPDTPWSPEDVLDDTLYNGKFNDKVLEVQTLLDAKGYPEVGTLDGKWGTRTRAAVLAFKADNGLGNDWHIDSNFLSALALSKGRVIAEERATATVADLRKEGAEDIKQADQSKYAGYATVAVGGVGLATKLVEAGEKYNDLLTRVDTLIDPIQTFISNNFWIMLLGIGGFVVYKSDVLQKIRLAKHRTGQDLSA